jgi:uncharacterized protein (DUF1810 family)
MRPASQTATVSLERFHQAQSARGGDYSQALAEIRAGRKRSHWIWYIFPQLAGLGHSAMALHYGIRDLDEALAYLRDDVLRSRYVEICGAVGDGLAQGAPVEHLMGSHIDALKLASSVTLFGFAAARLSQSDPLPAFASLARHCDSLLHRLESQGFPPCAFTLRALQRNAP